MLKSFKKQTREQSGLPKSVLWANYAPYLIQHCVVVENTQCLSNSFTSLFENTFFSFQYSVLSIPLHSTYNCLLYPSFSPFPLPNPSVFLLRYKLLQVEQQFEIEWLSSLSFLSITFQQLSYNIKDSSYSRRWVVWAENIAKILHLYYILIL